MVVDIIRALPAARRPIRVGPILVLLWLCVSAGHAQDIDLVDRGTYSELQLPGDLLFALNEHRLSPDAKTILREVLPNLRRNDLRQIIIEGHTDGLGNDSINDPLSLRRAQAVGEWLVEQGDLDPAIIRVEGKGSRHPRAPEVDPHGRALNRRVEIYFTALDIDLESAIERGRAMTLEWEVLTRATTLAPGVAVAVEAELQSPVPFSKAPRFQLVMTRDGEAEKRLDLPTAAASEKGRHWRTTGEFSLSEAGHYRLAMEVLIDGQEPVRGDELTLDVRPPPLELNLTPGWSQCFDCDAERRLVRLRAGAGQEPQRLLPIDLHASSTPIRLRLRLRGAPAGVWLRLPDGALLGQQQPEATLALAPGDPAATLWLEGNASVSGDAQAPEPLALQVLAENDSNSAAALSLLIAPAPDIELRPNPEWSYELTTGQPEQLEVAAVAGSELLARPSASVLAVEPRPPWVDVAEAPGERALWDIRQNLPWWYSPAWVRTGPRTVDLILTRDGVELARSPVTIEVHSAMPRWRLWLAWLGTLFALLLALWWIWGVLVKRRFDSGARIRYLDYKLSVERTQRLSRNLWSRYLVPFRPETSRVRGTRWQAGANRSHVYLLPGGDLEVDVDGQPVPRDRHGRIAVFNNQQVTLSGRRHLAYVYEIP